MMGQAQEKAVSHRLMRRWIVHDNEKFAKRAFHRLKVRLEEMYDAVEIGNVKGIAWFVCRKGENYESEL